MLCKKYHNIAGKSRKGEVRIQKPEVLGEGQQKFSVYIYLPEKIILCETNQASFETNQAKNGGKNE